MKKILLPALFLLIQFINSFAQTGNVVLIEEFTETNQGKAFYTSLEGLGEFIFEDYTTNRRKKTR